jgi:hypothetical protein
MKFGVLGRLYFIWPMGLDLAFKKAFGKVGVFIIRRFGYLF